MSWFRRTPPFEDSQLGRLTRTGKMWLPSAPAGSLGVVIVGGRERPDPRGVEIARQLLNDAGKLVPIASAFVAQDQHAMSFIEGHGAVECDGFTVYESGKFAVEFSLADWPDLMISVQSEGGVPYAVELGD